MLGSVFLQEDVEGQVTSTGLVIRYHVSIAIMCLDYLIRWACVVYVFNLQKHNSPLPKPPSAKAMTTFRGILGNSNQSF